MEDNEINQQVAQEILEGVGLNVTLANDGQEAVEAVKKNKYDAILMDIQMPVMDGYTASREIRKWEKRLKAKGSRLKANDREQRLEVRSQRTDDGRQSSEDRWQRSEVRGQKSEDKEDNTECSHQTLSLAPLAFQ